MAGRLVQAVDTNVLVRYLTADHAKQFQLAKTCIEAGAAKLISPIVLVETVWVLETAFKLSRPEIAETLDVISSSDYLNTPPRRVTLNAITHYKNGFDFADAMIGSLNVHAGAECTFTFDKKAAQMDGFTALKR